MLSLDPQECQDFLRKCQDLGVRGKSWHWVQESRGSLLVLLGDKNTVVGVKRAFHFN